MDPTGLIPVYESGSYQTGHREPEKAFNRWQRNVLRKKGKFLGNENIDIVAPTGVAFPKKSDAKKWNLRRFAGNFWTYTCEENGPHH